MVNSFKMHPFSPWCNIFFKARPPGQGASQAIKSEKLTNLSHMICYLRRIREGAEGRCYIWTWALSPMLGRPGGPRSHTLQNKHTLRNDPNRNTHPSKPAFIKVVRPTSNYRITEQPAGQTQRGPLVRCSCPENTLITVPSDPGVRPQALTHTPAQTPNTHLHRARLSLRSSAGCWRTLRVWARTSSQTAHIPG